MRIPLVECIAHATGFCRVDSGFLRAPPLAAMMDDAEAHREEVLLAASRAVLAAFRDSLGARDLPAPAIATLRLLETALEPYNGSALTL